MSKDDEKGPRLRGLDGFRAIAILLVLGQHLRAGGWIAEFPSELGRLGVALFFALSGYLITGILLDTPISLRRFYWRRSLRIFPAFYAYLAVIFLLIAMGWQKAPGMAMVAAATYWINFYRDWRGWSLQHLWSLAVEEQFYLCWPLVLASVGRRWSSIGLLTVFLAWPVQRYLRTGQWGHPDIETALFSATYDAIFWGCLVALWQRELRPKWTNLFSSRYVISIPFAVIIALYSGWWSPPVALVPSLRNAALAWLVYWVAQNQRSLITRTLDFSLLIWLGRRSYSLYLWHLIFMDPRLHVWISWPISVTLGILVAELSYRWIERPILAWRDRA